jgi:hypothetical protein
MRYIKTLYSTSIELRDYYSVQQNEMSHTKTSHLSIYTFKLQNHINLGGQKFIKIILTVKSLPHRQYGIPITMPHNLICFRRNHTKNIITLCR